MNAHEFWVFFFIFVFLCDFMWLNHFHSEDETFVLEKVNIVSESWNMWTSNITDVSHKLRW